MTSLLMFGEQPFSSPVHLTVVSDMLNLVWHISHILVITLFVQKKEGFNCIVKDRQSDAFMAGLLRNYEHTRKYICRGS
jgi:hypothetical protein